MQRIFLFTAALLITLIVAGGTAVAQAVAANSSERTVLLRNGGKITGVVLEDKPGDELVIRRADGEIFKIPYDRIITVSEDRDIQPDERALIDSIRSVPVRRLEPHIQLHGMGSPNNKVIGGHILGTAPLSRDFLLGIGVGYELDNETDASFLPVFAEGQYMLGLSNVAMVVYARVGWALGWLNQGEGSDHGGARFEVGTGTLWTFKEDGFGFLFLLGYVSQEGKGMAPTSTGTVEAADYMKIDLGVAF